jgi:predicted nucleic acid-binding protein
MIKKSRIYEKKPLRDWLLKLNALGLAISVIALLDACVLYSAPLRDLMMWLVVKKVFQARWSNHIHEEWIRNVLANRPDLQATDLERTRDLMDLHANDARVKRYMDLVPKLELPDANDCHVLAAAIRGKASCIVTFNLKDFPDSYLQSYGIKALHPDDFLLLHCENQLTNVLSAVHQQRQQLRQPPVTAIELLETFQMLGLKKTAMLLEQHISKL